MSRYVFSIKIVRAGKVPMQITDLKHYLITLKRCLTD
jgi:hypothetical protein